MCSIHVVGIQKGRKLLPKYLAGGGVGFKQFGIRELLGSKSVMKTKDNQKGKI